MDTIPEEQAAQIKAALFAGRKIEAIKIYREQTKLGLAESKAAIEALEHLLRGTTPESFTVPERKGGGCVAAMAVLGLLVLAYFFIPR